VSSHANRQTNEVQRSESADEHALSLPCVLHVCFYHSYLALAYAAVTNNLVRPQMTTDSVLLIADGRHLLQEKRLDNFVSNSTELGTMKEARNNETREKEAQRGGGLIHIITGPNNSGSD
jgi:DNA mismatch repair ATPase MutS